MAHGEEAARGAAETARRTFEEGASGEALPTLSVGGVDISLADALVRLEFCSSKKEARRLIEQGGARINGDTWLQDTPVQVTGAVRISAGKKKHGLLIP
jgi:tyrosyl-tRNA synthetase